MAGLKRIRVPLLPMAFAVTLVALLPGCSGESDDLTRSRDGSTLRTPSEIEKKAEAKNATLKKVAPAVQATRRDPQKEAQAKNALLRAKKKAAE
jgi:hypothetical protein